MLEPLGRAPGPQVTSAEQRRAAKEPSGGRATGTGQSGAARSESRTQVNAATFVSQGTEGGLRADHQQPQLHMEHPKSKQAICSQTRKAA